MIPLSSVAVPLDGIDEVAIDLKLIWKNIFPQLGLASPVLHRGCTFKSEVYQESSFN
jgi:hypothetical protein